MVSADFFSFLSSTKKGNMLYCYGSMECLRERQTIAKRMRENMSGENNRTPADRRKRVQTLKKLIIMLLVISIAIPYICCIVLFVQVRSLNGVLQTATDRLDGMSRLLEEQQRLMKEMQEQGKVGSGGTAPVKEAAPNEYVEVPSEASPKVNVLKKEAAHKVYLTFDDGPSSYTDEILDILDQYDIKATFFVVGKEDEASKEAMRQIVERGHSLGMHSYSHVYRQIYESVDSFAEDFSSIQDFIYEATGVKSTIYRFPGGSSNRVSSVDMEELAAYLYTQGVTFYDWNISSGDGGRALLSVQDLVDNSTGDIENWETSIILLHDSVDKRTTVEALPMIIENILAMEDTVILPITDDTVPVQHIHKVNVIAKE